MRFEPKMQTQNVELIKGTTLYFKQKQRLMWDQKYLQKENPGNPGNKVTTVWYENTAKLNSRLNTQSYIWSEADKCLRNT